MDSQVSLGQGLQITVICMVVVFITLYIISLIIELFKFIFTPKKQISEDNLEINEEIKEIKTLMNDEELVVAMTAAINMSNNKKNSKFRIIFIKQIG